MIKQGNYNSIVFTPANSRAAILSFLVFRGIQSRSCSVNLLKCQRSRYLKIWKHIFIPFFKSWVGFYKTRASCSMCFHFILRGFNTLGNFYWLFLAKIPNKKRGTLYVSRVIKNQIDISQCVMLTIMDWYTVW